MHAVLINYAFDSLSLNTIDNSLGNWIYTSLITTYCINKSGFFSQRFFPRCFSLSLSIFPSFSSPFLWRALPTIYPSSKSPLRVFFLFFFTLPVGFELSILYLLRQTSSLSSVPLIYMCLLPIMGNFQKAKRIVPKVIYCLRYCFLLTKDCMHNEVWGCAETLPKYLQIIIYIMLRLYPCSLIQQIFFFQMGLAYSTLHLP